MLWSISVHFSLWMSNATVFSPALFVSLTFWLSLLKQEQWVANDGTFCYLMFLGGYYRTGTLFSAFLKTFLEDLDGAKWQTTPNCGHLRTKPYTMMQDGITCTFSSPFNTAIFSNGARNLKTQGNDTEYDLLSRGSKRRKKNLHIHTNILHWL